MAAEMKKIISLCMIAGMVLALLGSFPAVAAGDSVTEDFESYEEYDTPAEYLQALQDGGWTDSRDQTDKGDGRLEVVDDADRFGEQTRVLRITANAANVSLDPYIQAGGFDMSGERVISFDMKAGTAQTNLKVTYRESASSGTLWTDLLDRTSSAAGLKAFGQDIPGFTHEDNRWYHVTIVTSVKPAGELLTYSIYIDGQKLVENEQYVKEGAQFKSLGIRFGISANANTTAVGYFDNIKISPVPQAGFEELYTQPANNSMDLQPSDNTVKIYFGTDIDLSTFDARDVSITRDYNGETEILTPADAVVYPDRVDIRLEEGDLPNSADYTVLLPTGIIDIFGNTLPDSKRSFQFGTVSDPNNQPPSVSITSPADGTRVEPGSTVNLAVDAADTDGEVVRAVYFANGEEIGRSETAPFTFRWENVPAGEYVITCRVYDNGGARGSAEEVFLRAEVNQFPVTIVTAPADGATVQPGTALTLTAEASDPNGEKVEKVEFYIDYQKIGEATASPYTCTWTPQAEGTYTVSAKGYDAAGAGGFSSPVTLIVAQQHTNSIFAWDFETFDGTASSCPSGVSVNTNNSPGCSFSAAEVDAEHGVSLASLVEQSAANNAPLVSVDFPSQTSGVLIAEADLMVDTTEHEIECFTVRGSGSSGTAWDTELVFSGGNVYTQDPRTQVMTYEANQWYHIRIAFNLDTKTTDIYINNNQVADDKPFQNTSVLGIPQVRFTHKSSEDVPGTMYVDNLSISKEMASPKLEGFAVKNAAGEPVSEYVAEDIAGIELYFSKALTAGQISADTVKLYTGYEEVLLEAEISYRGTDRAVVVTPQIPLKAGSHYRVEVDSSLTDTDGIAVGQGVGCEFRTLAGKYGLQKPVFLSGGQPLDTVMLLAVGDAAVFETEVVNQTGEEKEVWLITALYQGDRMERYQVTKTVVPAGGTQTVQSEEFIIDTALTGGESLRGFAWDATTGCSLGEQLIAD